MKNPFSKCVKIRRRVKKHKLNTKYASNYGAFHWDNSNFGESYSKKQSHDERNEATEQRQNSSREILSITATEMCFNSREDFISKLDLDISYVKEFTNEVKENIYFLLNVLYADEFVEDAFLLEIMMILFATKTSSKELHEDNDDISFDQDGNAHGLQEWMDIMSEKIYGSETQTFIARQGRIPGPVGRPVIGGCTMHKWLQKKPQ